MEFVGVGQNNFGNLQIETLLIDPTPPISPNLAPPDFPPDPHLMDFLVLAMGRKWVMLGLTLFCGIGAFAMTYIVPQTFMAMGTMLPPDRLSSSGLLSKYNSGFALEMLKQLENPSVDLLQDILESRSLDEHLAQDSLIHRYYTLQGLRGVEIVNAVRKAVKVGPGYAKVDVQGIVETRWFPTASEKENARELSSHIANAAIACMDSMLRAGVKTMAHETRLYADSDYALKRQELDSLDRVQEAFEQAHGVVKLETQTLASIDRIAQLKAERDEAEIQLRLVELDLSDNANKKELAASKLREAEQAARSYETDHQIGPALDSLPQIDRQYAELLQNRKELEPMVSFLRVETEQQRIFEEREKSFIVMLDPAQLPDSRISPIRSQTGFLGLIAGFALSIIYVAYFSFRLSWANESKSHNGIQSDEVYASEHIWGSRKQ